MADTQPQAPQQENQASPLPTQQPPAQTPLSQPVSNWQTAQDEQFQQEQQAPPAQFSPVNWSSAEFIEHEKSPMWYGAFAGATIVVAFAIFIITKEWLPSIAIVVVGVAAGFFSSRSPANRSYEIHPDKIKIDDKEYDMEGFVSFSVVEEGTKDSIWLKPAKRFAPFLIMYFSPEDEERIINALSMLLPHEARELDNLDKLTHKLRF